MNYSVKEIFVLILLFNNVFIAQQFPEMRVISQGVLLSDQIIDKNIRDANGEICAGLIIEHNLEGLTYDSNNGIIKFNSFPGRDFLFLSPNEQIITVFKTGFVPLKIILNEIGIKLKSGDVWKIEIIGDKFLNVGKGDFLIESLPAGAVIKIDGIPTFNEKTPFLLKEFNAQKYKITLSKDEYVFIDTTISITKDKRGNLLAKLEPKYGYITVDSEYSDFDLYIDNRLVEYNNKSPFKLLVGSHKVKVAKKYFKEIEKEVFVQPNDNQSKSLVLKPNYESIYRNIFISSEPNDAEVYINDEYVGITPVNKIFKAGIYSLKLLKENYREEFKNIEVYKNDLIEEFKLSKKGYLNILGTDGASVFINQKYSGVIPLKGLLVDPSDCNIRVVKDGYDSEERVVTISSETIDLEFNLAETEDRFFRFSAFGNERLNQFTPGVRFLVSGYLETIKPNLLSTATNSPIYESLKDIFLIGAGFSYTHFPFLIDTDVNWSGPLERAGLMKLWLITAKLGYCPFVFYERIFPYIGVMAHIVKLDVSRDKNSDGGLWHTDTVLFFNIAFRYYGNGKITVGYKKFLKSDAFEDGIYITWIF